MNFLTVMALPMLACLLLVLILPSLGQHVLARGVIFVDLALAQIAALGQSVAFLLGAEPHDPSMYFWSFGFTLLGAALFSFLWDREHSVLQEAFIGISFALATAATLLLLSNAPHGAEHVRGALSGEALGWVTWKDIVIMATLVRDRRRVSLLQPPQALPLLRGSQAGAARWACRSRSGTSSSTRRSGSWSRVRSRSRACWRCSPT